MGPTKENKVQRIHITVSPEILDRIERYRLKNEIPNRTTAIMELLRKGLQGG